jgi:asparagine synthase (glutamine-hydrolysing)
MAHPDLSPEMDLTAFWHYLTFIVAPAPLTMFRGVFKLPAAHTMSIDHQGRAVSRRYWDSCPDPARMLSERDLSEEEAVAEVLRLLRLSIRRRMVSDVPFGVLLSGGVDSSLNVALMSELMERPVTTFTIGYEGLEEVNEFEFARRVSRRYRTEHHETRINHKQAQDFLPLLVRLQDEPIADNVCIPLYFLAELVRRSGTTVVQVGEGADEHFLGYWWCEHYRRKERETYDPARRQRSAWAALLARIRGDLSASAEDEEIRTRARAGQELFWGGAVCWWGRMREQLTPRPARFQQEVQCPAEGLLPEAHQRLDSHAIVKHYLEALPNGGAAFDVLRKIPYLEMKVRLPEHLLMRVDKLTMAHSIEARVPFLDHDLVDFATKLPATYKLREGVGKYLLKRAAEPYLDADMIYRRKQGFGAPMEQWFREGDFGQRCLAAFERSQIRKEGFLDNQYVEGLLRAQIGGAGGYSFHIWTILNAVLWHEVWIQGNLNCI